MKIFVFDMRLDFQISKSETKWKNSNESQWLMAHTSLLNWPHFHCLCPLENAGLNEGRDNNH